MADFVAVIRRAVDGLSENTPEMRVRVYERARGAVQRQLENMKPRPPEDMLRRQLEKLDAAIREVEGEHSEALASAEAPVAEAPAAVAQVIEPAPAPEVVHPEPEPVPAEPEPVAAPEPPAAVYEPEPQPAPVEAHVAEAHVHHEPEPPAAEPEVHPEPEPHREEPAVEAQAEAWHQPAAEAPQAWHETSVQAAQPEESHESWVEQAAEPVAAAHDEHHDPVHDEWRDEPAATYSYAVDEDHARLSGIAPETVAAVESERFVEEVRADPIHAEGAGQFGDVWPETVQPEENTPKKLPVAEAFSWDANAFDELPPIPAPKAAAKPVPVDSFDDVDLFADVHGAAAKTAPKNDEPGDGWRELKELTGYDAVAQETADDRSAIPPDLDQAMVQKLQGKSFRVEPKPKRFSLGKALIAIVALAIVAGGGYLAWANRAAINGMVTGLVSSAPKTATVADKPATPPAVAGTEAAKTETPASAGPAAAGQSAQGTANGAPAGGENVVNNKFTQRLMADGSEVDDGPAVVPGQAVAEGKSVAEQNVAAAATTTPPAADAAAATPAPNGQGSTPPATPPAATQQAAATVGTPEKMFLYEERLGQTSPTAIEGTVTWSVQEEKGDDGRPETTVQGNLNVPERGLTAIITFKRNTDASLPASHLVELVFSLPPNFEGGAIESVQRIAMKATEQDRGDALIAVPAKITDDFHMVALNDFPDARKTNLDLLKSRSWIDIPITYRNGRRALLTLNKGATGTDAFNKVVGQWISHGDVSSSQ